MLVPIQPIVPVIKSGDTPSTEFILYLRRLEDYIRALEARIEALEP